MATSRPRRSALVGGLIGVTLIIVVIANGGIVSGLRSAGRTVVSPFAWSLNQIARPIASVFGGAANYSSVVQQNQQLRHELSVRALQSGEYASLQTQLQNVSSLMHLTFTHNLSSVVAQVTTNSPTNFSASFTVAKGRLDGILAGMPVVSSGGLIGRVVSTTAATSTVVLINDQSSIVGCTFGAGASNVLLYGRGINDPLAASDVPLSTALTPGTLFTTSGLQGGTFPPGLPVARVATDTLTPGSSTYNMTLAPVADLHNLSYVDVLLWEPST